MKTRQIIILLPLLLLAAFCGALLASRGAASAKASAAAQSDAGRDAATQTADAGAADGLAASPDPAMFQSPFPDKSCPGLPNAKCCLWQVFKMGEGSREAKFGDPYKCDTGLTVQGEMFVKVPFHSGGAACDPLAKLIPDNSVLEAKGHVIRRNSDGFGDFEGDFTIRDPAGTTLFAGCIETLDRVGTHISCEKCEPDSHYEGLLVGRGEGRLANFSIRASITGRGLLPSPTGPKAATAIVINGALVKCP
jgi:hypothetical protein